MEPIKEIRSRTVVLPNDDIDTDQIIPARFLTTTTKQGLGKNLFNDWRYGKDGSERPDFVLNKPENRGAAVLVAGNNFGCGSSREHAPWALLDFGIRAVVSTEIADIFRSNSLKNGLLPVIVDAKTHRWLLEHPGADVRVDLDDDDARGRRQARVVPDRSVLALLPHERHRSARLPARAERRHRALRAGARMSARIVVLAGDGVGPEVTAAAVRVLEQASAAHKLKLEFEDALIGGAAYDAVGSPLPDATIQACKAVDGHPARRRRRSEVGRHPRAASSRARAARHSQGARPVRELAARDRPHPSSPRLRR